MEHYICPVCGYDGLEEEPYINGGEAGSFEICSCCKFQFGYYPKKTIPEYRERWISDGAKWFYEEDKPENWNLKEQLKNINIYLE